MDTVNMSLNISFFLLPKCSGRPKYFPTPLSLGIDKSFFILSFVSYGAFSENVIANFIPLIFYPEAASYFFRMCKRV